jgi:chemotaxis-related protein WspB
MLFLQFQLGAVRYAVEARRVVEVIPLVNIQPLADAPPGVAGLFNYRGRPVPALDLARLTQGRPSEERLSTRILVVQCQGGAGTARLLGLIAEQAVKLLHKDSREFLPSGVNVRSAPYLGPVATDGHGVIQWIHEQQLLPEGTRDLVFGQTGERAHGAD